MLNAERGFGKAQMYRDIALESIEKKRFDFAGFSAQQAVEFFLKGFLIELVGVRPYTHSLPELLAALNEAGIESPPDVKDCVKSLAEHYIQARYPDARVTEYDHEEAIEAIKCMEVTLDFLTKIHTESSKGK